MVVGYNITFLIDNKPRTQAALLKIARMPFVEEFVKKILLDLKTKNLVVEIRKNPKGTPYLKRSRWKLSNSAHKIYKHKQPFIRD